ncbi:MAG TPA: hypothetical protein VLK82_13105 [Candidatus Tectomicrobia bacterium]|nr:hypothetical protein [Candidatus Tectomicrobia bacterium]
MAQHRTRRTPAKEGDAITPEQRRAAQEWLEMAFSAEQASPLLQQLSEPAMSALLPAMIEALGTMATPEAAALLTQVAARTGAKDVQKAARRALYRLKTRGVDTESVLPQESRKSVLEVPKLPVVAALTSQIDFDGNRALYLARRRPFSGLVFVSLIINDQRGVLDCNAFPVTKKDLTRLVADIRADDRLTHVELPPTYAQQLVEEGYQRNLSTGTPVPQDFHGLRDLIGTPDARWEQRPIYHLISPDEIRGQPAWLALSGQLLEVKEFQSWHLPGAALQRYREEVRRTADSPIIVSPALQQERVEAVQKRTLQEIFDAETCARYRSRLEDMAYLLWQTKRPDEARRALASALALQEERIEPAEHPFLRALFSRSIEMAEALEQQEAGRVTVASPRLWTP